MLPCLVFDVVCLHYLIMHTYMYMFVHTIHTYIYVRTCTVETHLPPQEKIPGRNKLCPVLVGISREGVLRLDKKTKAVLKVWPLTTVRSYVATPSSFSLVCHLWMCTACSCPKYRGRGSLGCRFVVDEFMKPQRFKLTLGYLSHS